MKVKIYLEQGAQLPKCAHDSDYGYDVMATSVTENPTVGGVIINGAIAYGTGIHLAFDPYDKHGSKVCMNLFARSSICKTGLILSNGKGIGDSGYRGEYKAVFYRAIKYLEPYKVGDKILQIALSNGEPIEWVQVNSLAELGDSERGLGGYGSTGK